ncbi:hypothetical protein SAMN04489732_104261 [Amycolatopsis saalfeldensis]|uniref:Uncharacterized protein n=1 Tax=Amycolatopsis saalfeldensis TaxID=394193 RepID=A0A1H8VSR8_9PSEU|nr:hypothetical protein SAMN04489732_104261 [Amycolatopsis saalfeldensis]
MDGLPLRERRHHRPAPGKPVGRLLGHRPGLRLVLLRLLVLVLVLVLLVLRHRLQGCLSGLVLWCLPGL